MPKDAVPRKTRKDEPVLNPEPIAHQVLKNCAISDSHHAGLYSLCGLALRLRDLYKWENRLEPWVEADSSVVLEWIGEKEQTWEELAESEYSHITISNTPYDPFDSQGINKELEPHGLLYGAGFVHSLKPTFFLAAIEEKRRLRNHPIYMLGREYARDILSIPAMSQDNLILVRRESTGFYLWDQILFLKKSGREALKYALAFYGLSGENTQELRERFSKIVSDEMETYIYHELGEIEEKAFDRETWRNIIAAFPHSPIELLARSVKDMLADTNEHGKLRFVTTGRRKASLALHVAFLDGLRKILCPELIDAFRHFKDKGNWQTIERAVAACRSTGRKYAEAMSRIFWEGKRRGDLAWAEEEMKQRLLVPLGIGSRWGDE
jgi:hypothetical protein